LLFSKHFNLQLGGRLAGSKREIKTETTGSFAYNFSVLKKVPEEPNFSVNRTALAGIPREIDPVILPKGREFVQQISPNRGQFDHS
jgi:hypothetical protein